MNTSTAGLRLIMQSEGCYLTAYKCPAGVLTIGYGHTSAAGSPEVHPGQKITQDEAVAILKLDVLSFEHYVTESVKVPLTQNEFDALVSFVFNVGPGNFRKSSLLKKLNKGDKASVPAELLRWDRAGKKVLPGLTKRRQAEAALWSGATSVSVTHDGPIAQKVSKPTLDLPPSVTHAAPAVVGAIASQQSAFSILLHDKPFVLFVAYTCLIAFIFAAGMSALPLFKLLTKEK